MSRYEQVKTELLNNPKTWLVTGVAGFIGSNLLEALLKLNQTVVGLDNFSTGHQHNLDDVRNCVTEDQWSRFTFHKGDIRNLDDCRNAVANIDYVLHQAALGSVPRSVADPITTNDSNVTGFLNMLVASRDAQVKSFTYAASSSTYGDHPDLPKVEDRIGNPLSPYAVTKYVNELYANVFARTYGLKSIGLRYFNVFGPRQAPNGPYAAVIPCWIHQVLNQNPIIINGDGKTTRDFSYVTNIVQANLLSAMTCTGENHSIYNIAAGERTSLNRLYELIVSEIRSRNPYLEPCVVSHAQFRLGDVRHSHASISKAHDALGYTPDIQVAEGISRTVMWYEQRSGRTC